MNHAVKLMIMKPLLLTACCIFLTIISIAQQFNWEEVQTALNKKQNLIELNKQLESYKQKALKEDDNIAIARCYWYQMQVSDIILEDTTYFTNSVFIDSILKVNKTPIMQSVMLVIKAKRIGGFRQRFASHTNKNLFIIPDGSVDFRKFSTIQLDSLVNQTLQKAVSISTGVKDIEANELLWLSTDPLLFLFKPGITDIFFA